MAKYKLTKVIPAFPITNASVTVVTLTGQKSILYVLSGTLWLDLNGRLDLTSSNGFQLIANSTMDLETSDNISFISDGIGATAQIIEWGV